MAGRIQEEMKQFVRHGIEGCTCYKYVYSGSGYMHIFFDSSFQDRICCVVLVYKNGTRLAAHLARLAKAEIHAPNLNLNSSNSQRK